jgi:hypothetical protein
MVSTVTEKIKKQVLAWEHDLQSNEEETILKAIAEIKEIGVPEIIRPLVETYSSSGSSKVKTAIIEILSNLKSALAMEELISCLADQTFLSIHPYLLEFVWHNRIPVEQHIVLFVQYFLTGNLHLAFEAFTVIDNLMLETTEDPTQATEVSENKKKKALDIILHIEKAKLLIEAYKAADKVLALPKLLISIEEKLDKMLENMLIFTQNNYTN